LYLGIQLVESYVLTPLIQERTVSLPPVVTIVSQVLAGLLAGGLGVALAQPLAAISMVLVKSLYVEGMLADYSVQVDPTPE
jgi:predicted PurR-regulated permease PerM